MRLTMADETLFALLHMEMIAHAHKSAGENDEDQGKHIRILEGMGFRVGQGLIERLTKDSPSFRDDLDTVKFVCKDFWTIIFKKQIDNLRTNHQICARIHAYMAYAAEMDHLMNDVGDVIHITQPDRVRVMEQTAGKRDDPGLPSRLFGEYYHIYKGTYVLQDNRFLLLTQISCSKQYLEEAPKFLAYTCGLIKGALCNLGISCTVSAEVPVMPTCKFQVVVSKN